MKYLPTISYFFQRCHLWNQYDGPRTCSYDVLQPREETCLCHLPRSCISHSCSKVGIFFCCLNKQHITTNHIYYLFRQIKIGINPIKKEATLFVSKPEYQNPWMFFVHSQVSVTARSNKLDGQFPGIYLYSTTSCTHWQLNRLLFGLSFAGKLKNDNNNIIVYNFLIIAELKNYCSDCEKDTVVERERGKGMERYCLIL